MGQGQDVTMDCFHYPYSSTRLLILIPEWAFNGGPEKVKEVLHSSEGMKADILVFDPSTVKSPATRSHPKQFPVGIEYVVVNGAIVVSQGQHTGALAGRALRHRHA